MWACKDEDGPILMEVFYNHFYNHCLLTDTAHFALVSLQVVPHSAVVLSLELTVFTTQR